MSGVCSFQGTIPPLDTHVNVADLLIFTSRKNSHPPKNLAEQSAAEQSCWGPDSEKTLPAPTASRQATQHLA